MYTPLGVKTDYSLLKSLIKIEDLICYAKNNNLKNLGILDNNLCSSHRFYDACKKNDIKPIIGLDITIDNYNLYLYPKNKDGLVNLFKLTKDKETNLISIGNLKNYALNNIAVLPYSSINIYNEISNIFDKVFLSYKNNDELLNEKLITENTIYINNIYALDEKSSKYINYLYMIENNLKLGDIELLDYQDNVIKMVDEDTSRLTDLIDLKFESSSHYIPKFDESIEDSSEYLKNLALKGLSKRLKGVIPNEYKQRLDYELSVIIKMGFTDYFLIVFDYVRYAVKNDIYVGPGRGSAVGSLVAYSLGITWIDPIKYDLLFERFLNPERITMPDIDIDFDYERREDVVNYVKERYGQDRVCKILTFTTMKAKEVLRTVGKINNIDEAVLNSLTRLINSKNTLKENLTDEVKSVLKSNSLLKKVYEESLVLEGLKKHISIHAAGVVISSLPISEIVPVISNGDEFLTGYEMDELEELGLLKMDFLSIKNLSILTNVLKSISTNKNSNLNINYIPLDDREVYELFSNGDTIGIFQFEKPGMINFLKRLKPKTFDDLVMAIAIYRPGPMDNIDLYVDLHNNKKKVSYIDPSLEPILKSTYGILIYQEQIMEILRSMGGFSYAEADIIRRAISKKKMDVMLETKEKFIKNAVESGHSEEASTKVFELITKFAEFGFNKSHSVAYAMIAYQMAYLKVHYKEHYYINLLNINVGAEAKTKDYIEEAKKSGIKILKPDVNKSLDKYTKEEDGIRLPFRVIKGVGISAHEKILSVRGDKEFTDIYDFVSRTYGTSINKKVMEALIYAGVFDSFGYNRATLIKNIPQLTMYADLTREIDSTLVNKPEMILESEFVDLELMQKEKELYGYYVSTHPASKYPDCVKQVDIKKYFDKVITTVCLIEEIKVINTKRNQEMAFVSISDETMIGELVVFTDYMKYLKNLNVGDLIKVSGHVEKRYDIYQIVAYKIAKI